MRILLCSVRVGRGHGREAEALTGEYLRRMGSPFAAEARVFKSEALLLEEVLERRRAGAAAVWLADGGGKMLSSEGLATEMQRVREGGTRVLVVGVGPADGWSAAALAMVAGMGTGGLRLSLGPMTLPHELARVVLAEQMYRATTILMGHPYHLGHE